jgi:PHD/YefM family antitoxin component YafN of YafNO toxin-antitoxin module
MKPMADSQIQYVSDETGQPVSVIVPIDLWREIESERETAYLLRNAKMKERLLRAKGRKEGIPFEEALEKLGIRP